jgi:tetratricopeptide (TPR) repeat protein
VQKKQLILLGLGLLLIIVLWQLGNFGSKKKINAPSQPQHADATHATPDFNIETYLASQQKELPDTAKARSEKLIQAYQNQLTPIACKDLAEFWESHDNLTAAAFYYKKGAFLENTEKSVTFAGQLLLVLMQRTQDQGIRTWQAKEAIDCFSKVLEMNPENTDAKIALATCYTEGTGETMKGVTLLREVTAKDSTHIAANIILGKLAIQSGQFDKAQRRLEMVVSKQPENTEAMYFLAEAYKGLGQKEKAVKWFEQCKKLVNSPEFSAEIDRYMQTMK